MNKQKLTCCFLTLLFVSNLGVADPNFIVSTFDSGPESWLVVEVQPNYLLPIGGGVAPDWDPSSGNPEGCIFATDQYAETFFSAPAKYLGNQNAAFNNHLSFDIKITYSDHIAYPAVILEGISKSLYYSAMPTPVGI